jgi:hypothetical protein
MSRRVCGVSGRFAGGRTKSAARGCGSKKRRCVSKKPTERKKGVGGAPCRKAAAAGATSSASG